MDQVLRNIRPLMLLLFLISLVGVRKVLKDVFLDPLVVLNTTAGVILVFLRLLLPYIRVLST